MTKDSEHNQPQGSDFQDSTRGQNVDKQPTITPEMLETAPEAVRTQVTETFGFLSAMPMQNPVIEKLTPNHISQIIEHNDTQSERYFKSEQSGRRYTLIYVLIGVATLAGFGYMTIPDNSEFFQEIVSSAITLLIGGIGGWGFSEYRKSRK